MFGNPRIKTVPIVGARTLRSVATAVAMALAALGMTATGSQAGFVLSQTFDDPTPTTGDVLGWSVALAGNSVLIGAPFHGGFVGQAHLFDATTGALLHTFDDPTVTSSDSFGWSVALAGNKVLIGAPQDNTNGFNVGQAHLFDATTGALLRTFDDPTATTRDVFGFSVALAGNRVLIGAPGNDTSGTNVGQAYLFDATSGALLRTFDDPTPTSLDHFGASVALAGNTVLIGAPLDRTNGFEIGQAHLFDATTGALLRTFDDPTVTSADRFGWSVALAGNTVLVGAPQDDTNGTDVGQMHLFDATSGALLKTFDDPTVTTQDQFGTSVALAGNNVLIGAFGDDTNGIDVGQAYLFTQAKGAAVPEPGSLPLFATGLLGLFALLRRRRRL